MPFVGSIIPPSSFGGGDKRIERKRQANRRVEGGAAGGSGEREGDEVMLSSVEETETERSVSGPASNDSEAGHEDRAQHGAYAQGPAEPARLHIDVQG